MADEMRFTDVRAIGPGVAALMTGPEVSAWARRTAEDLAAKANASAVARRAGLHAPAGAPGNVRAMAAMARRGELTQDPYACDAYEGRADTIGRVWTDTLEGRVDQGQNHTLDGLNH